MNEKKKNFYDDEYWRTGQGKALWQLRKMQAFIKAISPDNAGMPFFTILGEFEDAAKENGEIGWAAEWMDDETKCCLNIEYSEDFFTIYAFDGPTYETAFYYCFSDKIVFTGEEPLKGEDINPWSDFDKAITTSREWLIKHPNTIRDKSIDIRKQFGLS